MKDINEHEFFKCSLEDKIEMVELFLELLAKDKKHNVELLAYVSFRGLAASKLLTGDNIKSILETADLIYQENKNSVIDVGCSLHSRN